MGGVFDRIRTDYKLRLGLMKKIWHCPMVRKILWVDEERDGPEPIEKASVAEIQKAIRGIEERRMEFRELAEEHREDAKEHRSRVEVLMREKSKLNLPSDDLLNS